LPLTTATLNGMWAGMPVPWDLRDQVDEESLRENIRRICGGGVHGVYTHGTTGEFYAQTPEEWRQVAQATVEGCADFQIPTQIGCTALWTAEVVRRAEFAQRIGAGAIQIAFPFWLPLTDRQAVEFMKDVTRAVPEMPIVIYNTPRSKKTLSLDLLKRLLDQNIPLIGCKGVRNKEELAAMSRLAPAIKFFVGESELASFWAYGAQGCYSSFIYACPQFMLRYYEMCRQRDSKSLQIGRALQQFGKDFVATRFERGMYDTAFDRVFATMTGFLTGPLLRSRKPYDSPTEQDVEECRLWFKRYLPQFLHEV